MIKQVNRIALFPHIVLTVPLPSCLCKAPSSIDPRNRFPRYLITDLSPPPPHPPSSPAPFRFPTVNRCLLSFALSVIYPPPPPSPPSPFLTPQELISLPELTDSVFLSFACGSYRLAEPLSTYKQVVLYSQCLGNLCPRAQRSKGEDNHRYNRIFSTASVLSATSLSSSAHLPLSTHF